MKKTFPLLLLSAFLPGVALAAPTTISGLAKDGTNGNKPLVGATVQLLRPGIKGEKNELLSVTKTDAKGQFSFAPREYSTADLLMANVPHQGFDYAAVAFDGGAKLKALGIDVNPQKVDVLTFDTTTQAVPLDFQAHHLAIESTKTGLKVIERIVVENPTKRTLLGVGPRKISVLLDIPKGAKGVALDPKITSASLVQTSDGWGVVRPITPDAYGVRNALIVSYTMDWPSSLPWGKNLDLSHKVIYPTKFFFVARKTDDKALQITAPKLSGDTNAPVPIDGQTQTRLINSVGAPMAPPGGGAPPALPAGDAIEVSIGKPVNPMFWGFAAMTVALCLFLPLAMMKPRRKDGASTDLVGGRAKFAEPSHGALVSEPTSGRDTFFPLSNGAGTEIAFSSDSQKWIQKIADLDDLREAGKIGEDEYLTRRAAWKQQLIESLEPASTH